MTVTLPIRQRSTLRAGFERVRVVRRTTRLNRRQRGGGHRVPVLQPAIRVAPGARTWVGGRLVGQDGQGIAGAEVQLLASSSVSPEQLAGVLRTGDDGRFRYPASATARAARSDSHLPDRRSYCRPPRTIRLSVRAKSTLHVSRQRVLNGQAVTFSGHLKHATSAAGREARRAASAPVGPLADVPDVAHRRGRPLGDPVSVQAHARRAAVPIPRASAPRGELPLRGGPLAPDPSKYPRPGAKMSLQPAVAVKPRTPTLRAASNCRRQRTDEGRSRVPTSSVTD